MELKQLRYFTTVVDEGSISAAAARLHMSQPPLSTQMKLLERELGVVLFERGARRILLTEAGRLLYGRAQSLLHMASATERELYNLHSGLRGILRLGLISSSGTEAVRRSMIEFHRLYPDVHFEILEGNTFELLEALKNKEIEIALLRTPFPGETGLKIVSLCEDPMCAVGMQLFFEDIKKNENTEKKSLEGRSQTEAMAQLYASDLDRRPLILYRRWEREITAFFQKEDISPNVIMIDDDARTSLMWALSGLGIALVPASFAHAFLRQAAAPGSLSGPLASLASEPALGVTAPCQGKEIRVYPLKDQSLNSRLAIVQSREGKRSPIAEQFFQVFTSKQPQGAIIS